MVALSEKNKSRCRFHLGYSMTSGVPAGDFARLEAALNNIPDNTIKDYVHRHLDRCDRAWEETESDAQDSGIDYREVITGDINRSVVRFRAENLRRRTENYLQETNALAETLYVPNYRDPTTYYQRFYHEGGAYIKAVPGPADTSVGTRIYLVQNYA